LFDSGQLFGNEISGIKDIIHFIGDVQQDVGSTARREGFISVKQFGGALA